MNLLFRIAWRNIIRNKRRSLLTLAAIIFAAVTGIAMRGIQLGTYALNIKSAVELFSGYIQIQKKGYLDNPKLDAVFVPDNNIIYAIKNTAGISGYTERINAEGLISCGEIARGVVILGIEPSKEKDVTTFTKNIKEGKFFDNDSSNEIVLGEQLMKNLRAEPGDTIVLLAQDFYGVLDNRKFVISGAVTFGMREAESSIVFMGLSTAQSFLSMDDKINLIVLKAADIYSLNKVKKNLAGKINKDNLDILLWDKINPEIHSAIQLDNISGILFLGILIVIVAFGILNTVLMSVTERFREFGVVLSIGMPQLKLVGLVFIETFIISIIGIILGNIIGYGVNNYFIAHPVIFGGELKQLYEIYHFLPEMRSSLEPSIFYNISLSIFFISVLSSIYPAYKVYKLEPLKGIRHT